MTKSNAEHATDLEAIHELIVRARELAEALEPRPVARRKKLHDFRDSLAGGLWGHEVTLEREIAWYREHP